ncbi:Xaa-Pro peptidase family protein [Hydrogenivirga sp. 128-5-R1-1]|uniref:M24 family metallopeptidase n=1 Tax=Hydrogenivirga sp. 128-5-R1-1 TaxID=392423 RepID=UPI00015EF7C6|nr:Xaa-Pro peptidase family protein [Hydrogenivirga sp. 128-5-R1-1]EDP75734.1 xaa-pro dipeptidase [Hydrogenivirga sp. 128-5-R1-1]
MKLKEVQALIEKEGLDAFMFSSQANVFYLSRFRSTHAYAVITPESKYLLTDGRYYDRAKEELKDWEVFLLKGKALRQLKKFLREKELARVGYESDRVSCDLRKRLRSTRIKWKGYSNFLKEVRAIKTKEEINIMKEGVKKSDAIYRELLNFVRPGMTELEVRGFIVNKIFELEAEGESFPAIVASGEGSAIPHWETSRRKIKPNAPVLIDMGLVWKGYCTDFTRTFYLGTPDREFVKVYNIVRDAHLFALEKVMAGNKLGEVDRAARDYIKKKRYGKFFTHTTGHGVGVEIHEHPRVYYKGEDADITIEEGMVFTIEPGIYLPGKFGVRLENIVAVVGGRGESLSDVDLELVKV